MKKKYLSPEAELCAVGITKTLLAGSGEDLTINNELSSISEADFWD